MDALPFKKSRDQVICESKRLFLSKLDVELFLELHKHEGMFPYRCKHCNDWHIASDKDGSIMDEIERLNFIIADQDRLIEGLQRRLAEQEKGTQHFIEIQKLRDKNRTAKKPTRFKGKSKRDRRY